jgi:hypothetical protein
LDADELVAGLTALGLDLVDHFLLRIQPGERLKGDLLGLAGGPRGAFAVQGGHAGWHQGGDQPVRRGSRPFVEDANSIRRFAATFDPHSANTNATLVVPDSRPFFGALTMDRMLPQDTRFVQATQPFADARFSRRERIPFLRIRPRIVADGVMASQMA